MNHNTTAPPERVLIVGRSPSVLVEAVEMLRAKGYSADATNQFDQVLDDYDVTDLGILVFGGMVPPDTKQYLRAEISRRNPQVTFVQGLAGIAGLIAAQVEAVASGDVPDGAEIIYDDADRSVQLALRAPGHVMVEAFWATSFRPPEPTSTGVQIFDADLTTGFHAIPLPGHVPYEASFAAVTVDDVVRVFTVGAMPAAVLRMVPTSASDQRLPEVRKMTTSSDDQQ
ncbi:hypothetical protein ABT173_21960 [Streptomyces sp. NPDC001795]|uniref:hypothetical protein n=1 Tax=unclassified Streptomyces TaxID=2593676 RepID=UPI003328D8ED